MGYQKSLIFDEQLRLHALSSLAKAQSLFFYSDLL